MKIYLDTANLAEIREAARWGILSGVTTNPSLMAREEGAGFEDTIPTIPGLVDGPNIHIQGRVGWSCAENMMAGVVVVEKNAGSTFGAALRGGDLVCKGDVGSRTGIDMKGGTIIVGGDTGAFSGFMMQRGRMVVCGNAGKNLGDSMYDGTIYVGVVIAVTTFLGILIDIILIATGLTLPVNLSGSHAPAIQLMQLVGASALIVLIVWRFRAGALRSGWQELLSNFRPVYKRLS